MKKNFKTIMALTAALAVSVSGMSMASASAGSQTVNGDPATGTFDAVTPIPITLTTTNSLSATIDYATDGFKLEYSVKDGKFTDTSFNGTNNKLTVTNGSTCPIKATVAFTLDETYNDVLGECGFQLTSDSDGANKITDPIELTYDGGTTDVYLTATKTEDLGAIHGYNLANAAIGTITVTLESDLTAVNP